MNGNDRARYAAKFHSAHRTAHKVAHKYFHNRKVKWFLLVGTFIAAMWLKGEPITNVVLASRVLEAFGDDTMYDITHSD